MMQGAAAAGTTSVSGASTWTRATRGRASALASRHVGLVASSSSSSFFGPRSAATAAAPASLPLLRVRGGGSRLRPLSLLSGSGKNGEVAKAAAAAAAAAASVPADDASAAAVTRDGGAGGGIAATAQLGAMIVAWYLLNIYFNIYNKQVGLARSFTAASQHPLPLFFPLA
jgi:solute carrier family 35 protein E1